MKIEVDNRFIGELLEDKKLFYKKVVESKHLFKKEDAWAIDAQKFKDVIEPKCTFVLITDEHGTNYLTLTEIFNKKGVYYHFKPHRSQIFLPRRYFVKTLKAMTAEEIKQYFKINHIGI